MGTKNWLLAYLRQKVGEIESQALSQLCMTDNKNFFQMHIQNLWRTQTKSQ